MCLKFPLSSYTMLPTHNIAWHNFCSLFLNIANKRKRVEIQNCLNSSFSLNFCHWSSEKIWKTKCSILQLLVFHQMEGIQLPIDINMGMVNPLSVTNLLRDYDCMLKKGQRWVFLTFLLLEWFYASFCFI